MAIFEAALKKVLAHEGGYSDHPADRGGETYAGISRVRHPDWLGWERIANCKLQIANFPDNLKSDLVLAEDVRQFYRKLYWMAIVGEAIFEQGIAEELFEAAVNVGTVQAVKWLQRALNALNRNMVLWDDLLEDGLMGGKTLMAIRRSITAGRAAAVMKLQNIQQGNFYFELMRKDPTQEEFALGWLNRA